MSGGHFEYKCFAVSQFAEELQHEIDINKHNAHEFSDETMQRLTLAQKLIKLSGKLAREIEWLYSGDHGEESFNEIFDKIMSNPEVKNLIYKEQASLCADSMIVDQSNQVMSGGDSALNRLRSLAKSVTTELVFGEDNLLHESVNEK